MRSDYIIRDPRFPYFTTSTIVNWIPIFNSDNYYQLLLDNLKFYQHKYKIEIIAFVLMDNHFHMICKCEELTKSYRSFKSYTAKKIIDRLRIDRKDNILKLFETQKKEYKQESKYQIWQEGFHPQQIIDEKMLRQKIEYIHFNPVRRGLIENPESWEYSSANYYMTGKECGIEITRYI